MRSRTSLGGAYSDLDQVEKAIQYMKQSLAIFEEIKSPYAETIRSNLEKLEQGN